MRTSWADVVDNTAPGADSYGSTGSGAPAKPSYVPPHLRNRPAASEQAAGPVMSNGGAPSMNDRSGYSGQTSGSRWGAPRSDYGRPGYGGGGRGHGGWGNRAGDGGNINPLLVIGSMGNWGYVISLDRSFTKQFAIAGKGFKCCLIVPESEATNQKDVETKNGHASPPVQTNNAVQLPISRDIQKVTKDEAILWTSSCTEGYRKTNGKAISDGKLAFNGFPATHFTGDRSQLWWWIMDGGGYGGGGRDMVVVGGSYGVGRWRADMVVL
ncbi:hypothetical protein Tco_0751546 [Tanacetum coccineum]|uniref:Uncharacterized protein n=1 Tax=Tanacetum coccineum TaxID=301880 RepID=A0ABQ4Z4I2_9ASTR